MSSAHWRTVAFLTMATLATKVSACGGDAESTDDDLNYRSTVGREYAITTEVTLTTTPEIAALSGKARTDALVQQLGSVQDEIWMLFGRKIEATTGGHDAKFPFTLRHGGHTAGDAIQVDAKTFRLPMRVEVTSIDTFLSKLPLKTEGGRQYVDSVISNQLETFSQKLRFYFTTEPRSANAYPEYMALAAGGIDIALHVGFDHHTPRQDIDHARYYYQDFVASGFKSPVANFDALRMNSGVLTSSIQIKGKDVPVRIRLVHPLMGTPAEQIASYKRSMKEADIVVYDGHASNDSGGVMPFGPEGADYLRGWDFKSVDVGTQQQVYFFNGCHTYSAYADRLFDNAKRTVNNTDVLTAGNVVAIQKTPSQTLAFLHAFMKPAQGPWKPKSWDSILEDMNAAGEKSWVHVYGVHGIDGNPKRSPLADVSKVGVSCMINSDCGAVDSRCIQTTATKRVCGIACADSAGCPQGTKCMFPKVSLNPLMTTLWGPRAEDLQCLPQQF